MSGICSAHQNEDPDCPTCQAKYFIPMWIVGDETGPDPDFSNPDFNINEWLLDNQACPATCGHDCRCECRLTLRHMMNPTMGWGTHEYIENDSHDLNGNPCPWGPGPGTAFLAQVVEASDLNPDQ